MAKFIILQPCDLTRPEIIEWAAQDRVLLMADDENAAVEDLVKEILRYLRPLKGMLNPEVNIMNVRLYVKTLVEECYEMCMTSMTDVQKRNKFVCHVVGSLLQHKVMRGSASMLAERLQGVTLYLDSKRRYINEGRHRSEFLDIFSALDKSIPNYPSHLCSREQETSIFINQ